MHFECGSFLYYFISFLDHKTLNYPISSQVCDMDWSLLSLTHLLLLVTDILDQFSLSLSLSLSLSRFFGGLGFDHKKEITIDLLNSFMIDLVLLSGLGWSQPLLLFF